MIIVAILLTIISCSAKNFIAVNSVKYDMIELKISKPNNVETNTIGVPIVLEMVNNSTVDFKISSLRYWSNVAFTLKKDGELIHGIKVKPDMSKRLEYIDLKGGERVEENFDFNLDQIYGYLENGDYQLTALFTGNIVDEKGKNISILSEIKTDKEITIK